MSAPITLIYSGVMALIYVYLSMRVIGYRKQFRVLIGDGGHEKLEYAIRAHGNFNEYVPFYLGLSLLSEINGGQAQIIILCALVNGLGRIFHAAALGHFINKLLIRQIGMVATFISFVILALYNIYLSLGM